ncbi:alpha-L-arabinofuranosidase C-terminal domain-containing protein [Thermophagus xiamenensis]|uniref:non-reducing end alpha-L-arabinofuranosidase n=1 Tax=Thermophagus xiamenensis TaxID=385682 RepID=A0A1I2A362_9BACT|nr:alpha-L-arabinofuranosidase C-terminal domain-containing protein [Thermophagus xiamenensis]SFE38249.1 Alpha-L-arabinofuranosidase C-terminus [Thermophagus xiamenensis]
MKRLFFLTLTFSILFFIYNNVLASPPDSAYLFSYSTLKNGGRNGLHFAWSLDKKHWFAIGPEHSFLKSDYGAWGSQKRMFDPYLFFGPDGSWHCVWKVNDKDATFAYASSRDLIRWKPQVYPQLDFYGNCLLPVISYNHDNKNYVVSWWSHKGGNEGYYEVSTPDFIHYYSVKELAKEAFLNDRFTVKINNVEERGTIHKVPWSVIEKLINHQKLVSFNQQLYHETTDQDPQRFAGLEKVNANITVNLEDSKSISDKMIGVFFEDINYAADGGLYAELVQNRGFEYSPDDKKGRDPNWNSFYAWHLIGEHAVFSIDTVNPVHPNNPHYAVLRIEKPGALLSNEGFNGIALKAGENYDFSMFARSTTDKKIKVFVRLTDPDGNVVGQTTVNVRSSKWKKISAVIRSEKDLDNGRLELVPQSAGSINLDMVSLFPQNTFKGRKNGLRADLAQLIADINPKFVRFPGGCVAHGDGLDNIYRWKNTIGPLEVRKPQRNIWNYHQSMGLGFYEYFQFCEDIGAEPIPIVAAGVPCQNSSCGGAGQQGGIPLSDMDAYIQDILDLIEWANGDKKTKWGRIRAEAGHPEPFNLKYLGIGNEDLISHVFEERFRLIYNAVKEKYPDIVVIGTVGPFSEGSDYERGWEFAKEIGLPMVDEHYYQPPGWFIHNQDFYDKYDRSGPKVYLGEYAAHLPGRPQNIETALAEALYLTALERNGDVVVMASYAPLLAKESNTQWNPDLIYFNNSEVKPTVGYYIQKLFGQNSGNLYYFSDVNLSDERESVRKRFAVSVVRDGVSNDLIVKMVNLLPAKIEVHLKINGLDEFSSKASCIILAGHPDDTNARPQEKEITVSNNFDHLLPAYSFTVIRIPEIYIKN